MNTEFTVQTNVFEGPFGALLELIEKHKLSINEVSLSKITEEYLDFIKQVEDRSMGELSSFIVVAATLMLIKSRSLLPQLEVTEEEKGEIEVLTSRLEVFQVVKAVSGFVRAQYGKAILFRRPFIRVRKKVFSPGGSLTSNIIFEQAVYALEHIPREVTPPQTKVRKVIQIEEVLTRLLQRVQTQARFSFKDFSGGSGTTNIKEIKTFIVVSFLAVLELVKNGTLEAQQDDLFGDITLEKNNA